MTTETQAPEGAPALPEPAGMKWRRKNTDSVGAYFEDPRKFGINMDHPEYEWTPLYTADQMRAALAAQPQAALAYQQANPLGGPAKVFRAMADAIEAGDSYEDTLRRYRFAEAKPAPAEGDGLDDVQIARLFNQVPAYRMMTPLGTFTEGVRAAQAHVQPKGMPTNALAGVVVTAAEARGFVAFGAGVYRIQETQEPGLVVTFRRDGEQHYGIGDLAPEVDMTPIPADDIIVRLQFTSAAGLDSLEHHLRSIRAQHWPETVQAPAPAPESSGAKLALCPFCGRRPVLTVRPDNAEATSYFAAVACFCDGYAACAHKDATAAEADEAERLVREKWNRRTTASPAVGAEPADNDWRLPAGLKAGHVTFRKGVHCSALVSRMKVLHEAAFGVDSLTPEQKTENLAALQACKRPPHELAPPPPAATLTISIEGSTTTIDCDWGDAVRALPPGTYPLHFSRVPVQHKEDGNG